MHLQLQPAGHLFRPDAVVQHVAEDGTSTTEPLTALGFYSGHVEGAHGFSFAHFHVGERGATDKARPPSLFRRVLPVPPALASFASPRGQELFGKGLAAGTMMCYFQLAQHFATQASHVCALPLVLVLCWCARVTRVRCPPGVDSRPVRCGSCRTYTRRARREPRCC